MSLATPYPHPTRIARHAADRPLAAARAMAPGHSAPVHCVRIECGAWAVLTLIAFFTVLCTRRIPRPLFDAIAMTFRYEWRTVSYALFLREDYPPFDFQPTAADGGVDPGPRHSRLPVCLSRSAVV